MIVEPFSVGAHNIHNEGEYSERELAWRKIGAIDKARNLQHLLDGRSVSSVLEVGCGTGAVLAEVARLGVGTEHVGVDVADPHAHLDVVAAELQIAEYDGQVLPFSDNSFDFVFASHVVEHVEEPRALLRELKRVARDYVYLEVPCELTARTTRAAMQRSLNIGHINAFTPESFILLVQTSDLKVLDSAVFDHSREVYAFTSSRLEAAAKKTIRGGLRALNQRFASRVFTYHCGVLCAPE